jgi:hypothetical protein
MLIKDRNCDCTIGLTFPVNIPRDKSHEGRGVLCSAVTVSRCNKMDVFCSAVTVSRCNKMDVLFSAVTVSRCNKMDVLCSAVTVGRS